MNEFREWRRMLRLKTKCRWAAITLFGILMLLAANASAATRAWLDRSEAAMDQSVVLNIETDQGASVTPDYTPLRHDFEIGNPFRSQRYENVNGRTHSRTTFGMVLRPLREGQLTIPALTVGRESTEALTLQVAPAATATSSSSGGEDDVILETEVDDTHPYVQQTVSVVVRLNLGVRIASGQLELPKPDGAILQQVGDDVQSSRMIDGRRYTAIERRFLLIPESSGALTLPAPRFEGQSERLYNSWDFFDSNDVQGRGRLTTLQVRPLPAQAPKPWRPLQDLRLRYVQAPARQATVGEPLTLEVEMVATGATRAQFSDWPSLSVPGAEVFPEPIAYADSFVDGSQQLRMTRRYSVIPNAAGMLTIPGMQVAWWDAGRGEARTTRLPDFDIPVKDAVGNSDASGARPASPVSVPADASAQASQDSPASTSPAPSNAIWKILAIAMAVLWLLTMAVWWWQSKSGRHPDDRGVMAGRGRRSLPTLRRTPLYTQADLKRVIDAGDLSEVGEVLRQMHVPALPDLDVVERKLADPTQRKAVERLRHACWGDGDIPAARIALRDAFRKGPGWVTEPQSAQDISSLPPLYPPH